MSIENAIWEKQCDKTKTNSMLAFSSNEMSVLVAVTRSQGNTVAFETCPHFTLFAFLILIVSHCTSALAMPIKVQGVNSFRIIMQWRNNKQYEAVQKNLSVPFHSFPRLSSCHLLCQELLSHASMDTWHKELPFFVRLIDAYMRRKKKISQVQSIDLNPKCVSPPHTV